MQETREPEAFVARRQGVASLLELQRVWELALELAAEEQVVFGQQRVEEARQQASALAWGQSEEWDERWAR